MQAIGCCSARFLKTGAIVKYLPSITNTSRAVGAVGPTSSFEDSMTTGLSGSGSLLTSVPVRFRHKKVNSKVQKLVEGGISYHGFTYFPRHPNQKDPPYEPTKLFMVKRVRQLLGLPYWEKDLIKEFKLEDRGSVAIVKNCPNINQRLYKIKHLIEITPIKTPYGLPDHPKNGFLKENGDFVAFNCLEGHQMELEEAKAEMTNLLKINVDGPTLKSRLRTKWYSRYD